ncbi:hypothetical protein D9T17_04670 [Lysobacter enzymogenes]|uniref:Uncharacterized protein n=1 Tax=Lysobacter enzymogenes TaxID=69 RepID=A0A3N2RLM7_LYSEN|nr:hypothetical protein D9T17_04670 [Lysobacter enzymogenes]
MAQSARRGRAWLSPASPAAAAPARRVERRADAASRDRHGAANARPPLSIRLLHCNSMTASVLELAVSVK